MYQEKRPPGLEPLDEPGQAWAPGIREWPSLQLRLQGWVPGSAALPTRPRPATQPSPGPGLCSCPCSLAQPRLHMPSAARRLVVLLPLRPARPWLSSGPSSSGGFRWVAGRQPASPLPLSPLPHAPTLCLLPCQGPGPGGWHPGRAEQGSWQPGHQGLETEKGNQANSVSPCLSPSFSLGPLPSFSS